LGALGAGHTTKLDSTNFMGMTTVAAMSAGFCVAERAGVDRKSSFRHHVHWTDSNSTVYAFLPKNYAVVEKL